MRAILNISLPQAMVNDIKAEVRRGKYATTSEFFRDLIRNWQEDELVREINKGEAEIRAGKGIHLRSLRDLR